MGKPNGGKSTGNNSHGVSKNNNSNGNGNNGHHGGTRSRPLITHPKKSQKSGESVRTNSNGSSSSTNGHGVDRRIRHHSGSATPSATSSVTIPTESSSPAVDSSQTNFNYDLRLNGFSSLINTVKKSTDKVKKMLLNECDVILECRVCRNLFRSIPNYIAHKESFCTAQYHPVSTQGFSQLIQNGPSSFQIQHHVQVQNSMTQKLKEKSRSRTSNQKSSRLEQVLSKIGPSVESATRTPSSLYNHIAREQKNQSSNSGALEKTDKVYLVLDPLPQRKDGVVFQSRVQVDPSICETAGSEVNQRRPLCPSDTAVLDSEGKVMFAGAASVVQDIVTRVITQIEEKHKEESQKMKLLNCPTCQTVFETEKSLRTHARAHCRRKKPSKKASTSTVTSGTPEKKKEAEVPPVAVRIERNGRLSPDCVERPRKQEKPPKTVTSSNSRVDVELELAEVKEEKVEEPLPLPLAATRSESVRTRTLRTSLQPTAPRPTPVLLTTPKKEIVTPDEKVLKNEGKKGKNENEGVMKRMQAAAVAVIPFIPTSPIFSFKSGRATNNSCSASLSALSPVKSDLDLSQPNFPVSAPSLNKPATVTSTSSTSMLPRSSLKRGLTPKLLLLTTTPEKRVKTETETETVTLAPQGQTAPMSPRPFKWTTPTSTSICRKCHSNYSSQTHQDTCIQSRKSGSSIQIRNHYVKEEVKVTPTAMSATTIPPLTCIPLPFPPKIVGPIAVRSRTPHPRLTLTPELSLNGRRKPKPFPHSLILLNNNYEDGHVNVTVAAKSTATVKEDTKNDCDPPASRSRDPDVENNNQNNADLDVDPGRETNVNAVPMTIPLPMPISVSVEDESESGAVHRSE